MLEILLPLAAKALGTYAIGAAGVALTKINALIAAHAKNARLSGALNRAKDLALQVAKEMLATDLTKQGGMEALKRHVGVEGVSDLAQVVGGNSNVDKLLETLLEAAAVTAKGRDGIAVAGPPAGFAPLP